MVINSLRSAYEKNNMMQIQSILGNKSNTIFSDPEFAVYLDDLLRNIRLSVLQVKVLPYTSVKIGFLAKEINISERETRMLLAELILEHKINGFINQQDGVLEMNEVKAEDVRYKAMDQWASIITNIHMNLTAW